MPNRLHQTCAAHIQVDAIGVLSGFRYLNKNERERVTKNISAYLSALTGRPERDRGVSLQRADGTKMGPDCSQAVGIIASYGRRAGKTAQLIRYLHTENTESLRTSDIRNILNYRSRESARDLAKGLASTGLLEQHGGKWHLTEVSLPLIRKAPKETPLTAKARAWLERLVDIVPSNWLWRADLIGVPTEQKATALSLGVRLELLREEAPGIYCLTDKGRKLQEALDEVKKLRAVVDDLYIG
jgi:hypothetical protein